MTRWHTQTQLHEPEKGITGNCTQAAIASFFGLPLEQVPDFNTIHQHDEHAGPFWAAVEAFFAEQGYQLVHSPEMVQHGGMYFAGGPTERTTVHGGTHIVVMQAGRMIHDPHPSRAGLTDITWTYHAVPLDPATMRRAA